MSSLRLIVTLFCLLASTRGFVLAADRDARHLDPVLPAEATEPSVPAATVLPPGFVLETAVSGLSLPVVFDWAADGRMFIGEKRGIVRVFENGTLLSTPFVDIRSSVNSYGDRGMLGLALHPDFPTSPYLYLLHTYDPPELAGASGHAGPDQGGNRVARIVRFTADAASGYNVAVPGSELVILGANSTAANIGDPFTFAPDAPPSCDVAGVPLVDCIPADERSHTIGTLRFASDGSLFVSNGDGSSYAAVDDRALRSLDLDSLAGKILRIDPATGLGYSDNPFFDGDASSNRSKVYSYGLRNPFRFTLHPATDEPYIGDVGWGAWEEVNWGRGANFGWPCYEGGDASNSIQGSYSGLPGCQAFYNSGVTATPGVYSYYRQGVGSSAQVGDFYTGTSYPVEYRDTLFITDYNQEWIRYLEFAAAGVVTSVHDFGEHTGVVQMRAGPDTNLYLANIQEGEIKRLRFTQAGNQNPQAVASATPDSGSPPLLVDFSSAGSFDPDSEPLSYSWDFDDGSGSTSPNPSHTFPFPGAYDVSLTVTDSASATDVADVEVLVGVSRPTATILSPADGSSYRIGDWIPFWGTGNDPEDGVLTGSALSWDLKLHHFDHVHFDELPPTTGSNGDFLVTDHGDDTFFELCLSAEDTTSLSGTDCVFLHPDAVVYTFDTVPSGLEVFYESVSRTTPFSVTTIVNSEQFLTAPQTQAGYTFNYWSDGGDRARTVTVGSAAKSFVAHYVPGPGAAIADYRDDFQGGSPATGWSYAWNSGAAIGNASGYVDLIWDGGFRYDSDGIPGLPDDTESRWGSLTSSGGHPGPGVNQGQPYDRFVIASYTADLTAEYEITNSFATHTSCSSNGGEVRVYKSDDFVGSWTYPSEGSVGFDGTVGSVGAGETVHVANGPLDVDGCDGFAWDFSIALAGQALGDVGPTLKLAGHGNTTLSWTGGVGATSFKVRAADHPDFVATHPIPDDTHLLTEVTSATAFDSFQPAPGALRYYFVNATDGTSETQN